MPFLLRLAVRNLTRNVRRTVITSMVTVVGVALMILGIGMVQGLDENVIRGVITTRTAHVLVRPPGIDPAAPVAPTDVLEPPPPALLQALEGVAWTPRLRFDARMVVNGESVPRVRVVGYDPARDPRIFPRDDIEVEGAWPDDATPGVAMGWGLADLVGARVGDEVTISARTSAGALNALTWRLVGILRADNPAIDNGVVFMPLAQTEDLVRPPGPSEIAILLDRREDAAAFAARLPGPWKATTWEEEASDLLAVNRIRKTALSLVVVMVMGIAATGIANTIVMSVYERVREIGTLAAMGMEPRGLWGLFLAEGIVMGVLASAVGAAAGAALNHRFSVVGIDFSASPDAQGGLPVSATLYSAFSWPPVFQAMLFGVVVCALASLLPARHAARLNPADAVRAE